MCLHLLFVAYPVAILFVPCVPCVVDAAMYTEADDMKGVSGNIILGQLAPIGTACFDLLMDETKLDKAVEVCVVVRVVVPL